MGFRAFAKGIQIKVNEIVGRDLKHTYFEVPS